VYDAYVLKWIPIWQQQSTGQFYLPIHSFILVGSVDKLFVVPAAKFNGGESTGHFIIIVANLINNVTSVSNGILKRMSHTCSQNYLNLSSFLSFVLSFDSFTCSHFSPSPTNENRETLAKQAKKTDLKKVPSARMRVSHWRVSAYNLLLTFYLYLCIWSYLQKKSA